MNGISRDYIPNVNRQMHKYSLAKSIDSPNMLKKGDSQQNREPKAKTMKITTTLTHTLSN